MCTCVQICENWSGVVQGEFPDIKEANYLSPRGYTVDAGAPPALTDSLMYKLSYYGYAC